MQAVDPLSNHVILENIFRRLDVPSLKAVRLVSSLWKEVSLDSWRSTAVLVLRPDDNDGGGGRGGPSSSTARVVRGGDPIPPTPRAPTHLLALSEFQKMVKNVGNKHAHLELGRKPFSKYKLVRWTFCRKGFKKELGFLQRHGSLITYLHLDHCDFESLSIFEELLTRNLPNLEKLVWTVNRALDDFEVSSDESDDEGDEGSEAVFNYLSKGHKSRLNFQRSLKVLEIRSSASEPFLQTFGNSVTYKKCSYWTRLLYCMPAVEDVTLQIHHSEKKDGRYGELDVDMSPLLSGLKVVARLHGGSKIRKLDLMDFFTDRNSVFGGAVYSDGNIFYLPLLEELSLDWGVSSGEAYSQKVLANVSTTLQVLKAFRAPEANPPLLLPLPGPMDSLRQLYLYGNVTENLSFLRYTPNLQTLVMIQFCFDKWDKFDWMRNEHRTLRFSTADLVSNTEEVMRRRKIGEPSSSLRVPRLEHLEVDYPVNASSVVTLGKWMPNVKTVQMVMDNEILSASCGVWPGLEEIECLYRSEVDDGGVSSLLQCSRLRTFKLNSLCEPTSPLTSSSVNQFAKIGSLRELDICISDEISKEAEATLLEEGGLREVNLITKDHEDFEYECCEWTRFLRKVLNLPKPIRRKGPKKVPVLVPISLRSGRIIRPEK